jgi:hypothetical protein
MADDSPFATPHQQTVERNSGPPPASVDLLSANLFKVVSLILLFVACLLVLGLGMQAWSYWGGLHAALSANYIAPGATKPAPDLVDHAAVITYTRGLGSAFIKTSALFLGFILIFTGTLYVLRTAESAYQIHVTGGNVQGYFQTTSPGLVIVTLGVILSIVALITKTEVDYQKTTPAEQPVVTSPSPSDTPKNGVWNAAPENPGGPAPPTKGGS